MSCYSVGSEKPELMFMCTPVWSNFKTLDWLLWFIWFHVRKMSLELRWRHITALLPEDIGLCSLLRKQKSILLKCGNVKWTRSTYWCLAVTQVGNKSPDCNLFPTSVTAYWCLYSKFWYLMWDGTKLCQTNKQF